MNRDRSTVLQLLAHGRIQPAQAERLLAALSADRESAWAIAGCAGVGILAALHSFAPELTHLFRAVLFRTVLVWPALVWAAPVWAAPAGHLPALHHALNSIGLLLGGLR